MPAGSSKMPDRLMAGHRTLIPGMVVQIHLGQQNNTMENVIEITEKVIAENPEIVSAIKSGNTGMEGTLLALCMKRMKATGLDTASKIMPAIKQGMALKCKCGVGNANLGLICNYSKEINDTVLVCDCCDSCAEKCAEDI